MTIAARLQQIRGEESRKAFGARMGVHPNTVGNYERDRDPPASYVAAVAARCGVRLEWLITGHGSVREDDEEPTLFHEQLAYAICAAIHACYGAGPGTPSRRDRARVLRAVTRYLLQIGVTEAAIPERADLVGMVKLTGGLLELAPPASQATLSPAPSPTGSPRSRRSSRP